MDLFTSTGFLVNRLAKEMSLTLDRCFKPYDVTISQWAILQRLWQGEGKSQVELQEQLGLEGATVTGLLQRMERSNLVERKSDTLDKRMVRVYPTERGRSLEPVLTAFVEEVNARACEGFSADEQVFFTRLLQRALRNYNVHVS